MNYTTVEKIRVYLLKHESELDPDLADIFEEVIGRKANTLKLHEKINAPHRIIKINQYDANID